MKRACVAIGVGDAPPLDYLRGAVNGAHDIAAWARGQGYTTRLLTDEQNSVELDRVKTALEEFLAGGVSHLVIYFAGHGLSLPMAVADDLWLLSSWNVKRRGVSVTQLRDRLRYYGLDRLVLISDACRSPLGANTRDVVGDSVLDRGPFDAKTPHRDDWYAASPSRAAWMIPGRKKEETRCVFSGLMAEALRGAHEDALDPRQPRLGVTNRGLGNFLEDRVPRLAERYGAELTPEINTGIRAPDDVYLPGPLTPPPEDQRIPWPDPNDVRVAGMSGADGGGRIEPAAGESWSTQGDLLDQVVSRSADGMPDLDRQPRLAEVIEHDGRAIESGAETERQMEESVIAAFRSEKRPAAFETHAGFGLVGGDAHRALLGPAAIAEHVPYDRGWRIVPSDLPGSAPFWSVTGPLRLRQPLPLLVELADGRWVGAAALPNFVLSFTLDDSGALAAIYRAMHKARAPATEAAMAKLRFGALRREQAPELVAQLRRAKHVDPMLGVLAAYLHDAAGDLANVLRTAYFFARRRQPIPFDIALLGHLAARRDADGLLRVSIPPVPKDSVARNRPGYMKNATEAAEGVLAGAFPWLRQGWALLDPKGQDDLYPAGLADLAVHLLPAPFTTLDSAGGARLARLLFAEE